MRPMTDEEQRRYLAAVHGVQAGTKMTETSAMDCRIGLNAMMAEFAGVSKLLIDKGIISDDEYYAAVIEGVEREKARLEEELTAKYGGQTKITLV